MTQPGCTKMAISQVLLAVASSNLVGRKSKCYFIIKSSFLISIRLCWREIRPDAVMMNINCQECDCCMESLLLRSNTVSKKFAIFQGTVHCSFVV